jgi:hypothetical protein
MASTARGRSSRRRRRRSARCRSFAGGLGFTPGPNRG